MKNKKVGQKLETVQGVNVINQYHGNGAGVFEKMMIDTFLGNKKPVKLSYYELLNDKNRVVFILETDKEVIVQSAATRYNLNYRKVEFDVMFEDLDREEKECSDTPKM